MTLVRTFSSTGRVLTQVRHDPRTVGLLLVVPSLLIGLVAWIFTDTDVFQTIGPAMIALFPFIVMFLVTSIATLRERRSGTLERLFSMPLGKGDFILGYALAFGLLAVFQTAIAVSFASAGRTYQRFGIARSAMWCSTGWCVGPSSSSPTESCVHTQTAGRPISAERRTAGRM